MIDIKGLYFGYQKELLFQDFDLHLARGETTLITGINGTGKTTLLRLIAGVLQPSAGSVGFSPDLAENPRSKIGFISDQMHLYENMSVDAAIRFHADVYRIGDFDRSLLEKARIRPQQKIEQLSAGQKLLLHLSLILNSRPEILLIDEVIHSIDVYLREMFLNTLLEMIAEKQITLIMVNLNFHDIEKIPQRVLLLRNGEIAVDETVDQLKMKVKRIVSKEELTGVPILYASHFADHYEYVIYPYESALQRKIQGQIEDLNLHDIIKSFIGGEYA